MKTLKDLINKVNENFESNPGNDIKRGVTNHLTPINNIITNVKNLFGSIYSIVVEPGEDGVSLKLHSSKFTSEKEISTILYDANYLGNTSLYSYIANQGLKNMKLINLGTYYVVYFGPDDIQTADKPVDNTTNTDCTLPTACTEMKLYKLEDCELSSIVETYDDEELEDKTKEQLLKFINGTDKVKCANKLAELLADDLDLPEDYYFKGVKDADGNESIALRYKFQKRRPFGKTVELSKSLLNIYRSGDDAVWVEAFLTRDKNADELNSIVEMVLKLIGAEPTDDPCVYAITDNTISDLEDDVKDMKIKQNSDDDETQDDDLDKKSGVEEIISPAIKDDDLNN